MKIDQTQWSPVGAASRSEGQVGGSEVDRGERKKKLVDELEHESRRNVAPQRTQPIVLENKQVRLRFDKDKETGVEIIQVVDAESGKLVRQIPPEELLNIAKALREMKGLIVSKNR